MARFTVYASFGLVVFVASAAGSLYWQRTAKSVQEQQQSLAENGVKPGEPNAPDDTSASASNTESGELPVAVRPHPASTEEILRLGATMRNREEALEKREKAIQEERSRLKLIKDDIQGERLELESLQSAIHGKLAAAEKLLGEVALERQQLTQEREKATRELEEIKNAQTEHKEFEVDNLKHLSRVMEKMEPERAAELLRQMSNDGDMDTVIQLLGNLEDREAAKVLENLDDALATQLLGEFRDAKRPPTKRR